MCSLSLSAGELGLNHGVVNDGVAIQPPNASTTLLRSRARSPVTNAGHQLLQFPAPLAEAQQQETDKRERERGEGFSARRPRHKPLHYRNNNDNSDLTLAPVAPQSPVFLQKNNFFLLVTLRN